MAFFLLMLLYLVVDVYKFWGGAPLLYPGKSTCFLSELVNFLNVRHELYPALPGPRDMFRDVPLVLATVHSGVMNHDG